MTRIKYHQRDNILYTDWLTIGPNLVVRGMINKTNYTFSIYQFNSEPVYEGQASNLRIAKDTIKKQLVSAGVIFDGEIRKR